MASVPVEGADWEAFAGMEAVQTGGVGVCVPAGWASEGWALLEEV